MAIARAVFSKIDAFFADAWNGEADAWIRIASAMKSWVTTPRPRSPIKTHWRWHCTVMMLPPRSEPAQPLLLALLDADPLLAFHQFVAVLSIIQDSVMIQNIGSLLGYLNEVFQTLTTTLSESVTPDAA